MTRAEYYCERNRKIRGVRQAYFGKHNVSVTVESVLECVTAAIESDLAGDELIDRVCKVPIYTGIAAPIAGRPMCDGVDPLDVTAVSYLWICHRFDEAVPLRRRSISRSRIVTDSGWSPQRRTCISGHGGGHD